MHLRLSASICLIILAASAQAADPVVDKNAPVRTGTVEFTPAADEARLPELFRMDRHSFSFEERPAISSAPTTRVSKVTFPSPLVTPHPNNNTVHCEYFASTAAGKKPGVIVLHILGGDFDLARLFARALAGQGVNALFLKMPYYGERRQPGTDIRMISMDPQQTVSGMRQAVLDIRQAASWLAAQDEIDSTRLGIMGISLGGITAALTTSMEPRFTRACLLLAGGDMGEVAWTSTEMTELREKWIASGRTKQELFDTLKVVDPVTYARPEPHRRILMLNASQDEVVPPACTKSLWKAFGEPEIVWWDAGHYTAVRYIFSGMKRVVDFFTAVDTPASQAAAR